MTFLAVIAFTTLSQTVCAPTIAKASAASISEIPATFVKGCRYLCKQRFDNDAIRDILVIDTNDNFKQRCSSEPC